MRLRIDVSTSSTWQKKCVIPSEAEESCENEPFLLPRDEGFLVSFRVKSRNLVKTNRQAHQKKLTWRIAVEKDKIKKRERG